MNDTLLNTIIYPAIRHGLSALGAFLVAKGITNTDGAASISNLAQVIAGVGTFGISLAWSFIKNKILHRDAGK